MHLIRTFLSVALPALRSLGVAGSLFLSVSATAAAASATGSITGRVQNTDTGQFVNNARVTVRGTSLSTLTDETGTFRLSSVPSGEVTVEIFFTGLDPLRAPLTLAAGQNLERDFELASASRRGRAGEVVKLDSFVTSASREMDGAAIAINEQRFAANIVNVVAADEFGVVPDGNVGEFLKMLPGITMDYRGGDPREISMNGVPSSNVPVTIGGFALATSEVSGAGRNVELNAISINNLSRIEAVYSPTPETPGSALAGSVNFVPRSAFERSRPIFNGSVYLAARDSTIEGRTEGPDRRTSPTWKVRPGFEFSWIVPVNKRFGFTVSAGGSTQYVEGTRLANTWRGAGAATNGVAFPDTTSDNPYRSDFLVRIESKIADRTSFATTVDYKLSPTDRFSFSFKYGTFHTDFNQRAITFAVGATSTGNFSPEFTRGLAGRGQLTISNGGNHRYSRTFMPTLSWRHDGPVWKMEAGLGSSHAQNEFRTLDKGRFGSTSATRTGVTVSFADGFYLRPNTITVTDGVTGLPVDPFNIATYSLVSASSNPQLSRNVQNTAYANARRDFNLGFPLTVKGGLDVRSSRSDNRTQNLAVSFVGPDRNAAPFYDNYYYQRAGLFGVPRVQWVSNDTVLDTYRATPALFTSDENARYRSEVNASRISKETISAAYLRGDAQFFDRRLKLTGGLRAEQTNIIAQGPLTDPTRNFQRDAAGNVITVAAPTPTNPNARTPVLINANTPANALAISRLTFLDRATDVEKEYLRLFPSINAGYNLRENLIVRAAAYTTVGRPNFTQYSGAVTLPNVEGDPNDPNNRITVNNVGIKPWSAKSTKVSLEYYFERVGLISVGAFRRDIRDFFGATVFDATPEFLALYGLDPVLYDPFKVATQHNLTTSVRMTGIDVNYRQALTFLPRWARGVQIFANGSAQRVIGDAAATFNGFIPRTGSWGISLSREKYNVRMNWNYVGRQRRGAITGRSIEPGTYNWGSKKSYIDLTGEYSLTRRLALFANLRNVNDPTDDTEAHGPTTPARAHFTSRIEFGSLWTLGLKGTF